MNQKASEERSFNSYNRTEIHLEVYNDEPLIELKLKKNSTFHMQGNGKVCSIYKARV